jgi:hypothetical protein
MVGDYLIVTIVGDFDGDGNLNAQDVRYFADGLALSNGQLNRKQGFIEVDNAWLALKGDSNYFNTTLATCKAYAPGDARGDVAGSTLPAAPGALPQAHDGLVNLADVEYVKRNIGAWSNLASAAKSDLSADMNGDLTISAADVIELVEGILGSKMGDLDLNGMVDAADLATLHAHLGAAQPTYAFGDLDADQDVDAQDEAILLANAGYRMACCSEAPDLDQDCDVDAADLLLFQGCALGAAVPTGDPACAAADADHDQDVDAVDFAAFQRCLSGQNVRPRPGCVDLH